MINKIIINKEDDINYSFVVEYITESEDETIELINPNFESIISNLIIDGEQKEACTSYNFKSKGIHKIYYTLNLEGVTSFEQMFYRNKYLTSISFSPSFNMENITNVERWLQFCDNLLSLDLSHLNFGKVRSLRHAFSYNKNLKTVDLSNFYSETLDDFSAVFCYSNSLTFINLTNFNAPKLWEMIHTFRNCSSLISIDFTNFRAPKLNTLQSAFQDCISLKSVNLSSIESNDFRQMGDMFSGCYLIEFVYLPKITIKKEVYMGNAFKKCYSLKSIDLSNMYSSYKSDQIFEECTNLTYIDISSFEFAPKNLFANLPPKGEIKISKKVYKDVMDQIPEDWTIILIK